jgi:hypothetical protein
VPGTRYPRLQDIADEFNAVPGREQLQLEFSQEPALAGRYAEHLDLLESVPECQSPRGPVSQVAGGPMVPAR